MSKLTLAFSRVILSKDYAVYQCRLIALAQQTLWQVQLQRSQVLAKTFGLRVEACRGGDTLAQQALKHKVDGADARQRVAVYRVLACFWHQLLQFFNCQVLLQPGPSLITACEYTDICATSLVSGAGPELGFTSLAGSLQGRQLILVTSSPICRR
jgi:hypothetical protein